MQEAGPQPLAGLGDQVFLGLAVGPVAGASQGLGAVLLEGVLCGIGMLGVLEVLD